MSRTTVDWDEVVAGQYVYDPTGKPWRVTSRWSDGTVVMVDSQRYETRLPRPRGPVTIEGSASMEEAVGVLQSVLGARVIEVSP